MFDGKGDVERLKRGDDDKFRKKQILWKKKIKKEERESMVKKIVDKLKNDEEFIKERKVKNLIKVDDEIGRRLYEGISKN